MGEIDKPVGACVCGCWGGEESVRGSSHFHLIPSPPFGNLVASLRSISVTEEFKEADKVEEEGEKVWEM